MTVKWTGTCSGCNAVMTMVSKEACAEYSSDYVTACQNCSDEVKMVGKKLRGK